MPTAAQQIRYSKSAKTLPTGEHETGEKGYLCLFGRLLTQLRSQYGVTCLSVLVHHTLLPWDAVLRMIDSLVYSDPYSPTARFYWPIQALGVR